MVKAPSSLMESWQDPSTQPYVQLKRITRKYGDVYAVDDVSLDIYQGEFFSLLGSSGCGKSTLLRMLAGLEMPTSGRILIDGVDVTDVPPYKRPVNMMFQSYALFPHMSVENNIAFGLKQEKLSAEVRNERIEQMLKLLHIEPLRRRRPDQLSGGQRQRVALARSLAKHPKLLLLDEPLGALDKRLRENTQFELVNLQEKLGITFITVTHDQEEAMTMSSRIAVMHDGYIVQVDTPSGIYEYPSTRFVAGFVGSINLFEGKIIERSDGEVMIEGADGEQYRMHCPQPLAIGSPVGVAVRPEKIRLVRNPEAETFNQIKGLVEDIAYLGDVSIFHLKTVSGRRVKMTLTNTRPITEQTLTWGEEVMVEWDPDGGVVLTE
jgi:putrescine transport system ATP-binding protein